ncbi:MAG: DNA polymerase III subunit alpha [Proteobacteria bacterium]|nr:DNA polymerase III subunit alpha [Pseudomonadota bacterium]
MDRFVHLEAQSAFSFLWGTFTPEALVAAVRSLGQRAVALTDDGLFGVVRFYRAAAATGIQPIVGARVEAHGGAGGPEIVSNLTLLATDFAAYGNLCRILSIPRAAKGYGPASARPSVTLQDVKSNAAGLICLCGGRGSAIETLLSQGRYEAARQWLALWRDVFRDDGHLFVVLQNSGPAAEAEVMAASFELAAKLGLPVAATAGVAFLGPEDYELHKILVEIQRAHHHRAIDPLPHDGFYLKSGGEMARLIPYPEALANTALIARACESFELPVGGLHPPLFRSAGEAWRRLSKMCARNLARRCRPVKLEYLRRLERELKAIRERELSDFFLLVEEVIDFARRRGIRHTVRGSAAGSLVVHLLLGGVDPVARGLLFERFINDGRKDMPDVDVDFDSERRDEVLRHVMGRFPNQSAMVCTIHCFRVRSSVRLAARALGYSLEEISRLSECLPISLRGRRLGEALDNLPELRHAPIRQETRLVEVASRLAGLPFQGSVHLGGVIVTPGDINAFTPRWTSPQDLPVGQLDKDDVDALGLLKLDLLGLRMHTALEGAAEVLRQQGVNLDLDRLPLDDRRTFHLLQSTDTLGVFQVESPGQRNLIGRLRPRHFDDLVSEISLFRPGPVEGHMVDVYVQRRNGAEPVKYLHPDLEPILGETYGVILFQEHVLMIVHAIAGLSYGQADAFRRAMTKERKKSGGMIDLKERFMAGAVARGYDAWVADEIFGQVASFAAYGFCKAHAASFAHITYQSAWLKANFPQAFYLGLLNAGHVGSYPASVILSEAWRREIPIQGPHVNHSTARYEPEGLGIRVPLVVVHGVGPATTGRIVEARAARGRFSSLDDFQERVRLPARVMAVLELAGALRGLGAGDLFGTDRCEAARA